MLKGSMRGPNMFLYVCTCFVQKAGLWLQNRLFVQCLVQNAQMHVRWCLECSLQVPSSHAVQVQRNEQGKSQSRVLACTTAAR